jgi:hypothetical protein
MEETMLELILALVLFIIAFGFFMKLVWEMIKD